MTGNISSSPRRNLLPSPRRKSGPSTEDVLGPGFHRDDVNNSTEDVLGPGFHRDDVRDDVKRTDLIFFRAAHDGRLTPLRRFNTILIRFSRQPSWASCWSRSGRQTKIQEE